jgi:DNA replication and repair protein RecF
LLVKLVARDFRNLEPLDWTPGAGSHLLLGGNGAGKTSVLEAIYLLATTRSFRAAQIADCARHGAGGFYLQGEVEAESRVALEVAWSAGVRVRTVNGKATSLAEYLAVLPVVAWSTAAEAEVLVGAPQARRRFLDRGVVGIRPAAIEILGRFHEALRQKRELLLGNAAGLEIWNEMLATYAAEVIALRDRYVSLLRGELATVLAESRLGFPPVELAYRPSPAEGLAGRAAIVAALDKLADRERRRGLPLAGPQRDELTILWSGHEIRRVASAGERKALSLLLLAAHGRVVAAAGRSPVYLLDDADTELSAHTLSQVWTVFRDARQLFATSNRPQVWLTLDIGRAWEVERGALAPLAS